MAPSASKIRVASVQFAVQATPSPDAFFDRVTHYVRVAADYGADFVCFPEHFTLQVLSAGPRMLPPDEAVSRLTEITPLLKNHLSSVAKEHSINVIGGSHATTVDSGETRNIAFTALRDGSLHERHKLHPTPDEREVWKIRGGHSAEPIMTDRGPIGVMICYDSEFPEVARHLTDSDVALFFVPYCTDTRRGHLRVRYCCQARTVENQCYVVTSGLVGNVPNVDNMAINYAQSAVLTPSDNPFARDGMAAEATENGEMMIFSDLDMDALSLARQKGTVRNLADRRADLYSVSWNGSRQS